MKKTSKKPLSRNNRIAQRNSKNWVAAAISVGLFCQLASAQDRNKIDESYEKSIAANPSTAGMMMAIQEAQTQWEKEIEKRLKDLEKKIKPEEWRSLELTQKNWVTYRDSEIGSINLIFSKSGGSSESKLESSLQIMKLFKARALVLESYGAVVAE
jgi:uncharacterized protein YecT (DUF1311 family)